jgi:hypothetical protein
MGLIVLENYYLFPFNYQFLPVGAVFSAAAKELSRLLFRV